MLLPEVTALVIHVVPVIARMGPSQGAARHVVFALIQKKVIMAQSWLEGLDAATHRHWHYYLACIVAWLSSRGLNLADVTVSNLGLETQDGHSSCSTWRPGGSQGWPSGDQDRGSNDTSAIDAQKCSRRFDTYRTAHR